MRGFLPIYKRELFAFFVTPLAWALIIVFLVVQGMHFYLLVDHFASVRAMGGDQTPVQVFFGNTVLLYVILLLLVPPITMRLFAEERRVGTLEGLLTAPVSDGAVVLAKFSAAFTTYVAMWLPTLLYIVILERAAPLDWHVVWTSYLGVLLVGSGYLSLGLLASALTQSQFLALVITALATLALFILGLGEFVAHEGTPLQRACAYVSVWGQMNDFSSGIIDTRRLAFNLALTALPLYTTVRIIATWRLGRMFGETGSWSTVFGRAVSFGGIAAVGFLAVSLNVLAARHYRRWDVTATGRYTLSDATRTTLRTLLAPVRIWLIAGSADPLTQSLRQLLVAYAAESSLIEVSFVDPDRDTLALEDVRKRFNIETGQTAEGHVVTDAIAVVSSADRHWFLFPSDMIEVSHPDDPRVKPKEEQALTLALRSVTSEDKSHVCFTAGHGELSLSDGSSKGLGFLKAILEKNNYEAQTVDATLTRVSKPYDTCTAVVVAGPSSAFSNEEAEAFRAYAGGGGNLLVAAGPLDAASASGAKETGLTRVLEPFGIRLETDVVVEQDESRSISGGHGVEFVADVVEHPITAALVQTSTHSNPPRVWVHYATAISIVAADGAVARTLLMSSPRSFAVQSVWGAADGSEIPVKADADRSGPFNLAVAGQRTATPSTERRGGRAVVLGTSSLLAEAQWGSPQSLRGGSLLVEAALAWLIARPIVVDIPSRDLVTVALRITDAAKSEIRRYTLFYMPLAALTLALVLAYFRHRSEGAGRPRAKHH